MAEVMNLTKEEVVAKKFEEDPAMQQIVKVQKKKKLIKRTKSEQIEKDAEIQKLLGAPQDINYDKAMQIYEEQQLEATEITNKEKRRLRRLKKKAEKEMEIKPNLNAETQQATSIKIEEPIQSENIDSLIR